MGRIARFLQFPDRKPQGGQYANHRPLGSSNIWLGAGSSRQGRSRGRRRADRRRERTGAGLGGVRGGQPCPGRRGNGSRRRGWQPGGTGNARRDCATPWFRLRDLTGRGEGTGGIGVPGGSADRLQIARLEDRGRESFEPDARTDRVAVRRRRGIDLHRAAGCRGAGARRSHRRNVIGRRGLDRVGSPCAALPGEMHERRRG